MVGPIVWSGGTCAGLQAYRDARHNGASEAVIGFSRQGVIDTRVK